MAYPPPASHTKAPRLDTARRAPVTDLRSLALFGVSAVLAVCFGFSLGGVAGAGATDAPSEPAAQALGAFRLVVPTIRYGLEVERFASFEVAEVGDEIRLEDDLRAAGLPRKLARELTRATALEREGLTTLPPHRRDVAADADGALAYVMIEVSDLEYLRYDLAARAVSIEDADGIAAEFETATLFYDGDVDSMLAETGFDGALAGVVRRALVEEMPLDTAFRTGLIKLIYTAKKDENGITRGFGEVEAMRYGVGEACRTTYRFADDDLDVEGFFHPDGTTVTRTWLEQPVAEGVMSSPFNPRRRHPVLRRIRPHYGTDYAADYGEPILALSDGVVVAKSQSRGNGNFVKIAHDDTYASQYLHMKGFARGLRPGQRVRKGDVIGYVGSTGLSSGPHVCLRFWKHGRQVDFRRELRHLPTTPNLDLEAMAVFERRQAELGALLEPRA